ncbi:MAG: sigma-70 family RNA polymerase sigma factor [Candidatus Aminicenantes bacterium]|nr:MAG: sigma-70 family RNA polymerase sigma factor [Candidatus Aminicenantes bacterium]
MSKEVALNKDQVFSGGKVHTLLDREMSEREILEVVQKGDKEAYGAIVKRYMHSAYYIALGFVHNQQDALDVSQDAFIKAFRKIKMFDTSKPFFPWFYRLLRNLCIDQLKRKRRMREIPLEDVPVFSEEKEDRELKETLWKGIEKLSFEQREIVILRYFRQYSYAEIAELIGKPIGTVMSSLFYAKKKLKGIVGKYMGFE